MFLTVLVCTGPNTPPIDFLRVTDGRRPLESAVGDDVVLVDFFLLSVLVLEAVALALAFWPVGVGGVVGEAPSSDCEEAAFVTLTVSLGAFDFDRVGGLFMGVVVEVVVVEVVLMVVAVGEMDEAEG